MRAALIAAVLCLPAPFAHAQSRPAPDTPGESEPTETIAPAPRNTAVDAIRVLVVTSGVIGGFVAADIVSGGALTGPLLAGAIRSAGLRPIIAGAEPASRAIPEVAPTLAQALARFGGAR